MDGITAFANAGSSIVLGKDLRLTEDDGNELSVCTLAIKGRSVLVERCPVSRTGREEMTVGELIRVPEGHPNGLCVVVDGCGKGYDDLSLEWV